VYVGIGKKCIVVACDEELVRMGLRFEPGQDVVMLELGSGYSEVTCVDEDVAIWESRLGIVGVVSVGNADDADLVGFVLGLGRPWSIQQSSQEEKRTRFESFPDCGSTSIQQGIHRVGKNQSYWCSRQDDQTLTATAGQKLYAVVLITTPPRRSPHTTHAIFTKDL
jgi:hypothetical protein